MDKSIFLDVRQGYEYLKCVGSDNIQIESFALPVDLQGLSEIHLEALENKTNMFGLFKNIFKSDNMFFIIFIG